MNTREIGTAMINEVRSTGCNLITIITSNKYYMISKNWFVKYCYKPSQIRVHQLYNNWL